MTKRKIGAEKEAKKKKRKRKFPCMSIICKILCSTQHSFGCCEESSVLARRKYGDIRWEILNSFACLKYFQDSKIILCDETLQDLVMAYNTLLYTYTHIQSRYVSRLKSEVTGGGGLVLSLPYHILSHTDGNNKAIYLVNV